jgi:hypothetical protein
MREIKHRHRFDLWKRRIPAQQTEAEDADYFLRRIEAGQGD